MKIHLILVMLTFLTITKAGKLNIENLNSENGYTIIKYGYKNIVDSYSNIVHIIKISDIELLINTFENTVNKTNKSKFIPLDIYYKIEDVKTQVKTIKNYKKTGNQRQKRGLFNLGGNILKFIFGTMDEEDRLSIEEKLRELNDASHELIQNNNKQVKINLQLQTNIKQIYNRIIGNTLESPKTKSQEELIILQLENRLEQIDHTIEKKSK